MKQCEKQDVIDIDDDEEEVGSRSSENRRRKSDIRWIDPAIGSSADKKKTFYESVDINQSRISNGDFVLVRSDDPNTPGEVDES